MDKLEFKAAFTTDDTGRVEGKAWDFAGPDRVGDIIEPDAFAGAVGKLLPMLFAHDQAQAIGTWDGIAVEPDGLKVTGKLLVDDVARAREVRALVQAKSVTGLSVGFVTRKALPRKGGGRTITALDLVEISLVAVPAHDGARVSTMKDISSMTAPAAESTTIDQKALDAVNARIDAMEAAAARLAAEGDATEPTVERKAFGTYLRLGNAAPAEELKTLTVSSDPQGGYLAPAEMSGEFLRDLVEFSPIRSLATVRSTGASSVSYPRRTSVTNAKWKGETQASEASEPGFGQVEIPVREINTYVDISNQLLADSGGVAEGEVRLALSEDFGSKESLAFVSGVGPLAPEGLLSASGVAYTATGNSSTLGSAPADLMISHFYSLRATYRARGTWLMNGSTLAAIRKLKDGSTGNYLWQPAYAAGQPETILGRPVVEVPDMADVGSGTEPIVFGDIATAYRIIDRLALSILVNPYIRATEGITRVHATRRVGAAVVQPAAIRKIKCATS